MYVSPSLVLYKANGTDFKLLSGLRFDIASNLPNGMWYSEIMRYVYF